MGKLQINEALAKECLERYLSKTDSSYFTAPEYFSPLYRSLYENLLANKLPPYYNNDLKSISDELKDDIRLCNTTFDRYLVLLYPSRYEASNPLPLNSSEIKINLLIDYLHSKYGKTAKDRDSYNYDREVKNILSLLPKIKSKELKEKAKSALYKILVLSYKLSSINYRWRELIQYIDPENLHNASMDNIVDFNMLNISKARENSALVKMFYFELDQGKNDGDVTQSRRIMILPFAFDFLFKAIMYYSYYLLYKGHDLSHIETKLKSLSSQLDVFINESDRILVYEDKNQELVDLIQSMMLKNIYSNGILARKYFEDNIDYKGIKIFNHEKWITNIEESDLPRLVENELGLANGAFDINWLSLADTLAKIVIKTGNIPPEEFHFYRNISCILIAHLNGQGKIELKSKIQGAKHNIYSPVKELEKAHKWLQENDPNIDDKHHLSLMKPTTLHFFSYAIGQLIWTMDCNESTKYSVDYTESDYNEFRKILFNTNLSIITKLRYKDHVNCLSGIEYCCKQIFAPNFSIDDAFLNSMADERVFFNHICRANIYWSPLSY
ncbi:hypothetical protein [Enterobacter mori]|uniref:hypothetical protein n=1 Tax=Enterobacter mori TaxID=539813 RepID=UPI001B8AD229|nr:hypothetical protein [Enterobacter mori]MBS3048859.1 hypothetical protein [Enterobacter mori]